VLAAKPDPRGVPVYLIAEGPPDALTEARVQDAADKVLRVDSAGQRWRVAPVFPDSDADRLGGFYELCGRLNATTLPRTAFDAAYRLEDELRASAGPTVRVRPDLESSIYGRAYALTRSAAPFEDVATRAVAKPDWSLDEINCKAAWVTTPKDGGAARGRGVVVGHPDTGFTDSIELDPAALDLGRAWDFVANDGDARDPMDPSELPEGHGTRTGSVIVSREAGQVTGVAPEARLLPLRATTSVVLVRAGGVARAVEYARGKCDVISMSLGGILVTNILEQAINAAVASGTVVMAAGGNYNWAGQAAKNRFFPKPVVAPAAYRNCIAVGGSTTDSKAWWGSARGSKILVCAPGDGVFVPQVPEPPPPAKPNAQPSAGTSYGVAHLAGVAALWLAHHGAQSLRQKYGADVQRLFAHVIQNHGAKKPPGWDDDKYGVGIVDAKKVLDFPLPDSLPTPRALEAPPTATRSMLETALGAEEPGEADDRIAALFGPRTRGREDQVDRFGDEVAYLLGEHPEFLARMNQAPRDRKAASDVDATRTLLLSTGSPQLIRALAGE
jgi:hypothetical protein